MRSLLFCLSIFAMAFFPGVVGGSAMATTIFYSPVDLPDVTPGANLWRYDYIVRDFPFSQNQSFTIYFDRLLYRDLESPPPSVGPDWDVLTLQPDPNLPDNGAYDALALIDNPSLAPPFSVSFLYLGTGSPGSQRFDINQFDVNGNLQRILDTGFTQPMIPEPAIPEPATGLLCFSGLGALLYWAKQKQQTN